LRSSLSQTHVTVRDKLSAIQEHVSGITKSKQEQRDR